jgi:hypothetical protein
MEMDHRQSVGSRIGACSNNNLTFLPQPGMKFLFRREVGFEESVEDSLVEPQVGVFWVGFVTSVNDFPSFVLDLLI